MEAMAYRDDYEAAVEHAADLERELTRARVEQAHDRERIAELEAQLADARRRADAARSGKSPQPEASGKMPQESGKKPQTAVRGSRVFWPAFSSLAVAI